MQFSQIFKIVYFQHSPLDKILLGNENDLKLSGIVLWDVVQRFRGVCRTI